MYLAEILTVHFFVIINPNDLGEGPGALKRVTRNGLAH